MKKIFSNNRLIAIAFFTVFSATAVSVSANDSSNLAMPVELKLIGSINDQPLIQLIYAGTTVQDDFTIIRYKDGNSL